MKQCSVIVGEAAGPHETAPRRNAKCADGVVDRPLGLRCSTVYEFALECFERGGKRRAIGWRDVLEVHEETKTVTKVVDGKETEVEKTWLYYEMSGYSYNTYEELMALMHDYGRGLVKVGLKPGGEEKLHIFAGTSHKWMKTFLAAQSQAIPVVTAYDTLGESGLIHSIAQTNSKAIFTDNILLGKLINPVQKLENVKCIIHSEKIDPNDKRHNGKLYSEAAEAVKKLKELRPDIVIYSMDEVITLGIEYKSAIDICRPTKESISCVMYTSGSTGTPKGVTMTHANIVAGVGGVGINISRSLIGHNDTVIAFLPLAHILELAVELLTFYWGALLGYGTVKTLTDNSVRNCQGDMKELKPTIMVGIAAVWESVRKGILTQVAKQPKIKQKVFWMAYRTKLHLNKMHIPGGDFLGDLFFKKVREATGGKLRYILNGGSSISKDTQIFISNLICPMLLGYGLTETVANAAIMPPEHFKIGTVGDITGSITMKLVDVEELGYFAKNNQGEVWIKGGPVLKEYYDNEEETKAVLEDGWFKTGDIGEWTEKGQLRLIDRKKNLVKTLNGEYIALEKLESVYRSNRYVGNICIYADQHMVKPVAIVVPAVPEVTKLAIKMNLIEDEAELRNVYGNKKLKNAILQDMHKTAKSQGLAGIEMILGFIFVDEEWTPQNGLLTAAQKLQRRKILALVKDQVDELYANNG
ncbi:uncharacterized protein Ecym_2464 [Eremothecium cymbalariae DBVPG|uniref:AMP-dependent synthetase/ligase domain-containing protein n=1 Tax=Eremothecium cymbalariae (strain CBS 270.75 / DBVPG 7215 / KCTC 17166 / NRRL Y-17582) TaxID=931890 RepID=G8JPT2_ERECY|nr:Hypothetical protein Ecym_2464 [Eremothecium cymbalariae DBVPG\